MSGRYQRLWGTVSCLVLLIFGACTVNPPSPAGRPCSGNDSCGDGFSCDPILQVCVQQIYDGGALTWETGPARDSGKDQSGELSGICSAQSCPLGCCHAVLGCQPGTALEACGSGGYACQDCSASDQVCANGQCRECSTWAVLLDADLRDLAMDSDGTIYLTGHKNGKVYLAALDPCGRILREQDSLPAGASSAEAHGLALEDTALFIGGLVRSADSATQGLSAAYRKSDFSELWTKAIGSTAPSHHLWDAALAGELWLAGSTGSEQIAPAVWGAKVVPSSQATCDFQLLEGVGEARAIAVSPDGQKVFFTGHSGNLAFLASHAADACPVSSCEPCLASWSQTFQYTTLPTEGLAVMATADAVYVAGVAHKTAGDSAGIVFRINPTSGAIEASYFWDPTPSLDILYGLVSDGSDLYAVGGRQIGGGQGAAMILKLTPDTLTWQWERESSQPRFYRGAARAAPGYLLVMGGASPGMVRRTRVGSF